MVTAPKGAHVPRRTCVVCRGVEERGSLLRIVLGNNGELVGDFSQSQDGRGAYVHVDPACLFAEKTATALRASLIRGGRREKKQQREKAQESFLARLEYDVRRNTTPLAQRLQSCFGTKKTAKQGAGKIRL